MYWFSTALQAKAEWKNRWWPWIIQQMDCKQSVRCRVDIILLFLSRSKEQDQSNKPRWRLYSTHFLIPPPGGPPVKIMSLFWLEVLRILTLDSYTSIDRLDAFLVVWRVKTYLCPLRPSQQPLRPSFSPWRPCHLHPLLWIPSLVPSDFEGDFSMALRQLKNQPLEASACHLVSTSLNQTQTDVRYLW